MTVSVKTRIEFTTLSPILNRKTKQYSMLYETEIENRKLAYVLWDKNRKQKYHMFYQTKIENTNNIEYLVRLK